MYHENLQIWKRGLLNTKNLYKILAKVDKREFYSLIDQIKRCSLSIPSNIAEGSARDSYKEFRRFLAISLGSSAELQTQLQLLKELVPNLELESIMTVSYTHLTLPTTPYV